MIKGGIGGGNTQTGINFEGRIDIISYLNDSVDGYECKLNANSKGKSKWFDIYFEDKFVASAFNM